MSLVKFVSKSCIQLDIYTWPGMLRVINVVTIVFNVIILVEYILQAFVRRYDIKIRNTFNELSKLVKKI